MACTIGAKILRPGAEYVMFKNKDFARESFSDRLVAEDDVFGVMGLHLPLGNSGDEDVLSGFSIGVNAAGLCACNSHVRSIEGGENYDDLTEAAVRGAEAADDACEVVADHARSGRYNWSNILIVDPNGVGVVEIADSSACASDPHLIARANCHLLHEDDRDRTNSRTRKDRATALLAAATSVEDVMQLCQSHEGEAEGTSICAHGKGGRGNTVYSYIMHWREGELTLWVRRGPACGGDYAPVPLRFPLDGTGIRVAYPGCEF